MIIQKSKKGVKLKFKKSFFATVQSDGAKLNVSISPENGDTILLERPGEYEHEKLNIILKEILSEEEKFSGFPNLASITYQGLTYTVFFQELEITKSVEDELPNTNLLLCPLTKGTKLKKYVKAIQPEKGVFVDLGNSDVTIEKLNSEFSKLLSAEDGKIKIKESELNAGEELIQEFYVL